MQLQSLYKQTEDEMTKLKKSMQSSKDSHVSVRDTLEKELNTEKMTTQQLTESLKTKIEEAKIAQETEQALKLKVDEMK